MPYPPSQDLLARYAELLVNFGLGGQTGLAPGAVVWVRGPENSKPLFVEACRAVWRAGGHVIRDYAPADDELFKPSRDLYELGSDEQLDFFAEQYSRGLIDQADHILAIHSPSDPLVLRDIPAEKIMRRHRSSAPMVAWQVVKEAEGRFSFTIGLYPTEALASEAGLSLDEYWDKVIAACYLDEADPVTRWRELDRQISETCRWLNELEINRLHLEAEDTDLWLTLGENRRWIGGGGANIPSFEAFTSPDWRGTEGRIRFTEPLYTHGSLIRGIGLEFREGRIVRATAEENEELLQQMLATEGADRVGEFSLTDGGVSPIDHFMANTLFDENMGGRYGNTHLAVGLALRVCYAGNAARVSDEEWERLGFNFSSVHTDIVSTADRTVTARLRDGSERVIYAGGRFQRD